MPNLAQQAAINVGSLPSDIEALNQVTKYHDDTVARQRELTQLSRGQIDLARASDDLHSGRLEAERRIQQQKAWEDNKQARLEDIMSLDVTDPNYQSNKIRILGGLSDYELSHPLVTGAVQAMDSDNRSYNVREARNLQLLDKEILEQGLTAHQRAQVNNSINSDAGFQMSQQFQIENASGNVSRMVDLGILSEKEGRRFQEDLHEAEVNPDKAAEVMPGVRELHLRHSTLFARLEALETNAVKSRVSAEKAQSDRDMLIAKERVNVKKSVEANKRSKYLQFKKAHDELYKGRIPEQGDSDHKKYTESSTLLASALNEVTKASKDVSDASKAYDSVSGNFTRFDEEGEAKAGSSNDPTSVIGNL